MTKVENTMRIIEVEEIKERLLVMLEHLNNIFYDNGLKAYVAGGTLLGAVRHGGFIPWDDDIDLHMPRHDYDRFIEICKKSNDGRYKLLCHEIDSKYNYTFCKFIDTTTLLIEKEVDAGVEMGLFIDIFPVDGMGDSIEAAKRQMIKMNRYLVMNYALLVRPWRKHASFIKNFAIACFKLFVKAYGANRLYKNINKLARSLPYETSKYVGEYIDAIGDKRIVEKDEVYGDAVLLNFENLQVNAPIGWDKYLSQFYGDYMQLPPIEQQVLTHGYELYDKTKGEDK